MSDTKVIEFGEELFQEYGGEPPERIVLKNWDGGEEYEFVEDDDE